MLNDIDKENVIPFRPSKKKPLILKIKYKRQTIKSKYKFCTKQDLVFWVKFVAIILLINYAFQRCGVM